MAEVKLTAETRTDFGKGAARRIRKEDKVPCVIYGHGAEPRHVSVNGHALLMALRTPNVLIKLDVGGKHELVIPKAVQREAIRGFLVHVDLLIVKKGEKVTVDIPIHIEGELAPGGNLLEYILNALPVEAEATHIPEGVTISIEGLEAGHTIHAKDIPLPRGTSLAVDGEDAVLQIVAAQTEPVEEEEAEEEEEAAAEGAAEEEGAAPEGEGGG
ncbi:MULTISPECIES: 50S ribosomal protein L25/general stress protein Ctc [Streptomyces]|uniref:50S ribosomal protein L25/general stress protein Ctc n=1 Tax=Streptomyces TaxID=1883 RepID=UPI00345B62A3